MPQPILRRRVVVPVLVTLLALLVGCIGCSPSSTGTPAAPTPPGSTGSTPPPSGPGSSIARSGASLPTALELSPIHVVGGERPHFEDAKGREVLLRGVNVNSFGDYFQGDPSLPPTVPVTGADWDRMASLGFSAVRFIISWSAVEPEKGRYDDAYLAKVKAGVAEAGKRGIYVIVDMHQDAWGKYVASPEGTTCDEGAEPAIGWDGAPQWATAPADAAATCRVKGARELSKVVRDSFASFYADDAGWRTALAKAWGHVAEALAGEPAVAGYDLFNEPNPSGDAPKTLEQYTAFVNDSITAIRAAEKHAGIDPRIAFVEPIVTWPLPSSAPTVGSIADTDLAFAPHNYFGSISKILTPEQGFAANTAYAKQLNAAMWTGEYGWWSDDSENMAKLRRFAIAEDQAIAGGAWWQWRQACGDPHSINNPERKTSDQLHLIGVACPGDKDKGVTAAYATVLSRSYPRAAPGSVVSLTSDPDKRTMTVTGRGASGELVVWVPDAGKGAPTPKASGVTGVEVTRVDGGYYVTGTTACAYALTIDGDTASAPQPAC